MGDNYSLGSPLDIAAHSAAQATALMNEAQTPSPLPSTQALSPASSNPPVATSHANATIPLPPPSKRYQTFEELFEILQDFHRDNGAAISKANCGGKRQINGVSMYTVRVLKCDRADGNTSTSVGLRTTSSSKTNCPFRMVAKVSRATDNLWTYTIEGTHNHGPSKHPSEHATHRRRTQEQRDLALSLFKHSELTDAAVHKILVDSSKEKCYFSVRDITNDRTMFRKAGLIPHTPKGKTSNGVEKSAIQKNTGTKRRGRPPKRPKENTDSTPAPVDSPTMFPMDQLEDYAMS